MYVCEHGKPNISLYMFPPKLRMLDDKYKCKNMLLANRKFHNLDYIPVTHCKHDNNIFGTSDETDSRFYYYAKGCSDVFLKTGNVIVGYNKFDVHLKMLEKVMGPNYINSLKVTQTCGLSYSSMIYTRRYLNPCAKAIVHRCLPFIRIIENQNLSRLSLAIKLNITTMIYLYEAGDSGNLSPNRWKTEVQRTIPYTLETFYKKNGSVLSYNIKKRHCIH